MKFSVVAYHAPEREGTATGRILRAWCEGVIGEGHELECWSWTYTPPEEDLPSWCRWEMLPGEPEWRTRVRALVRPRRDIVRARWQPPDDAICVGDDVTSFPAVRGARRSVMTLHYLNALDARAVGRRALRDIQSRRAERHVARDAGLLFAYSDRVAAHAAAPATVIPMGYELPDTTVDPVDDPVALMAANWEWPPNVTALGTLLAAWPEVRSRVPGATLLLAGRALDQVPIGVVPGVRLLGSYARAVDVLSLSSVLVFPCPPSSGPKVKVAEALAHGVPVVTTRYGVEGLAVGDGNGTVVADGNGLADALVGILQDPERRARLASLGRHAIEEHHSPRAVARARLAACRAAFGDY